MSEEVKVKVLELDGEKTLGATGFWLIGHTNELERKIRELDIDPENFEDGDVATTIEIEGVEK